MIAQYVKIVQSGDTLEIYEYEKEPNRRGNPYTARKVIKRRPNGGFRYVRADTARRRKSDFKRLCYANLQSANLPVFFTFTFERETSVSDGYVQWTAFIVRLRKSEGKLFSYIVVPEFGTKGTKRLHFHALFWGLNSAKCLSERETRYFADIWGQGYLDCFPTDGSPRLGSYFAKYMHKALTDPKMLGQKAYRASRNVLRPQTLSTRVQLSYFQELYGFSISDLSTVEPLLEKEYKTEWLGKGRFRLFNLHNINENNLNK